MTISNVPIDIHYNNCFRCKIDFFQSSLASISDSVIVVKYGMRKKKSNMVEHGQSKIFREIGWSPARGSDGDRLVEPFSLARPVRGRVLLHAPLQLRPEVTDQTLHRPSGTVAQGAYRVT